MSKLKTHKSLKKRVKKQTKSGKFLVRHMSAQHRTRGKATRTKQASRKMQTLSATETDRIKQLLPYE